MEQNKNNNVSPSSVIERLNLVDLFFSFNGRISRKTYWLYCFMPLSIIGLLFEIVDTSKAAEFIFKLIVIWLSLALHTKRWHDLNESGFWQLIVFIPIVGIFIQIVICGFIKGTEGSNKYGQKPV